MRNEFSKETKQFFYISRYCMLCGRVDLPIELHHICWRISNSPLNCIRICKTCHEKIDHSKDYERMLFIKTYNFLKKQKYNITNDDKQFLIDNLYLLWTM